jgi:hypothetical protein
MLCSFDQTHAGAKIQKDCNMDVHELFQFGRRNVKSVLWPVAGVLELFLTPFLMCNVISPSFQGSPIN